MSNTKIHSLQAIRAIAAWLVVADHALLEVHHGPGPSVTQLAWTLGSVGVDCFFVISGFIMVYVCWGVFGCPDATLRFLGRRMVRIVPLYWLTTLFALAYHKVSSTHGAHDGWPELLSSLAFIPYMNDDGLWHPVSPQGWTLNYEMMFYAVFALVLSFPRKVALIAVTLIFGLFVTVGPLLSNERLAYLAAPIVLWFVAGVWLGACWRSFNLVEPACISRRAKALETWGDASYSTYLVHGLVLTLVLRVWVLVAGPPSVLIVPASIVFATAAGWVVHRVIEVPLLKALTRPRSLPQRVAVSL